MQPWAVSIRVAAHGCLSRDMGRLCLVFGEDCFMLYAVSVNPNRLQRVPLEYGGRGPALTTTGYNLDAARRPRAPRRAPLPISPASTTPSAPTATTTEVEDAAATAVAPPHCRGDDGRDDYASLHARPAAGHPVRPTPASSAASDTSSDTSSDTPSDMSSATTASVTSPLREMAAAVEAATEYYLRPLTGTSQKTREARGRGDDDDGDDDGNVRCEGDDDEDEWRDCTSDRREGDDDKDGGGGGGGDNGDAGLADTDGDGGAPAICSGVPMMPTEKNRVRWCVARAAWSRIRQPSFRILLEPL